ncbi:hypothetical protein MRX96_024707 [Rhipicephalus microplus]
MYSMGVFLVATKFTEATREGRGGSKKNDGPRKSEQAVGSSLSNGKMFAPRMERPKRLRLAPFLVGSQSSEGALRVVKPGAMNGCAARGHPEEGRVLLLLGCPPVLLPKVQQRRDSRRSIAAVVF